MYIKIKLFSRAASRAFICVYISGGGRRRRFFPSREKVNDDEKEEK
jgi:hypothetical protein